MQKNITLREISTIKEGNTNGKDWKISRIKCEGDQEMLEFTTFNNHQDKIDQQFQGNFEYNEKFKNWQEISVAKEAENSKHDEIMNAIRKCWDKIDDVEKLVLDKQGK